MLRISILPMMDSAKTWPCVLTVSQGIRRESIAVTGRDSHRPWMTLPTTGLDPATCIHCKVRGSGTRLWMTILMMADMADIIVWSVNHLTCACP